MHSLKISPNDYSEIEELLHSLQEHETTHKVSHLEYTDNVVVFYRHVDGLDFRILVSGDTLLETIQWLKKMSATLNDLYPEKSKGV
jgi:hypothetical protein